MGEGSKFCIGLVQFNDLDWAGTHNEMRRSICDNPDEIMTHLFRVGPLIIIIIIKIIIIVIPLVMHPVFTLYK